MSFAAHIPAIQIETIPVRIDRRGFFSVELPQENMRERLDYRGRRAGEEIGHADVERAILEPDETVGVCEGTELHVKRGECCPGFQFAKDAGINLRGGFEK